MNNYIIQIQILDYYFIIQLIKQRKNEFYMYKK
jgi:hypothetical protein